MIGSFIKTGYWGKIHIWWATLSTNEWEEPLTGLKKLLKTSQCINTVQTHPFSVEKNKIIIVD